MRRLAAILAGLLLILATVAQASWPSSGQIYPVSTGGFVNIQTLGPTYSTSSTSATRTVVAKFQAAGLATTGSSARITVRGAGACTVNNTFIGQSEVTGNAWNFDGSGGTRITASGSNSYSFTTSGQLLVLDATAFSITKSSAISVAFDLAANCVASLDGGLGPTKTFPSVAGTNFVTYTKSSVNEAGTTLKGSAYGTSSATTFLITKIEALP